MHKTSMAMTEGSITRNLVSFAMPLLLGNLFQQTYNIADAAIVGQTLGSDALAAVGTSSSVQLMVLGFCQGLAAGFGVPVATAFGAGDETRMRKLTFNGGILTAIWAVVLCITTYLLCPMVISVLKTPSDIAVDSEIYLRIIFLGIPFTLLYNFLSAVLRAIGDSRTPFYFLAFSSVLNIFLDFFCILVLKWGVGGAAIATIFSQGFSGVLCLVLIRQKFEILWIRKEERKFQRDYASQLMKQGVPMGLNMSITAIGSMVMQMANNALGTVYVSAFAAGLKIKQFTMCPFDAIAATISTFVSQNYGAGNFERMKAGIRKGLLLSVVYGVIIGALLWKYGRVTCMLFVGQNAGDILDAGALYLSSIGTFYWVLGILKSLRQAVQGMGWARQAVFAGIIEMIGRTFVSALFVTSYGYGAICWADQTAWTLGAIFLIPVCKACLKHVKEDIRHRTQSFSVDAN